MQVDDYAAPLELAIPQIPTLNLRANRVLQLTSARRDHLSPVRAQKGGLLQGIAGVLAPGKGEIEFRLNDGFVAMIGQGKDPRVGGDDLRIARRPQTIPLRPYGIGEHIIDLIFECARHYAIAAVALAFRNRQRVEPGIRVKHYLGAEHDRQAYQLGIASFMADYGSAWHPRYAEQCQCVAWAEETFVAGCKVNLRIAEAPSTLPIEYDQGIEPLRPREGRAAHQHTSPRGASFGGDRLKSDLDLHARYFSKVAIVTCYRAFGKQDDIGTCSGRATDDFSDPGNVLADFGAELHLRSSDGELALAVSSDAFS